MVSGSPPVPVPSFSSRPIPHGQAPQDGQAGLGSRGRNSLTPSASPGNVSPVAGIASLSVPQGGVDGTQIGGGSQNGIVDPSNTVVGRTQNVYGMVAAQALRAWDSRSGTQSCAGSTEAAGGAAMHASTSESRFMAPGGPTIGSSGVVAGVSSGGGRGRGNGPRSSGAAAVNSDRPGISGANGAIGGPGTDEFCDQRQITSGGRHDARSPSPQSRAAPAMQNFALEPLAMSAAGIDGQAAGSANEGNGAASGTARQVDRETSVRRNGASAGVGTGPLAGAGLPVSVPRENSSISVVAAESTISYLGANEATNGSTSTPRENQGVRGGRRSGKLGNGAGKT